MTTATLGSLFSLLVVSMFVTAGCVIMPKENEALNEARMAYVQAANDPQIVEYASLTLRDAQDALNETQRLVNADADQGAIVHHAYLTKQHIAIARELAQQGAAEEEIRQAEAERQQILLEAQTQEARRAWDLAEQRAQEANQAQALAQARAREAEMARQQAARAQERAQEMAAKAQQLTERVRDLKAQETERGLVVTLGDLLFDAGEAQLKPAGTQAIDKLAEFLKQYPERNILIEGYTDSTGDAAFNQQLSERRANAVRDALLADAISPDRMRTIGYGEQFPVASNATSDGRQQNRRVEVIISDKEGSIPNRAN
ncbi:MAG TPA: OmpA family protein [Gammaproteobacteria bacterium]|nr:OmpA family protein [Gammaproteobacteria bacterium]